MPGESSTSTTLGAETDDSSLETTSITTARNCGLAKNEQMCRIHQKAKKRIMVVKIDKNAKN